MLGDYGINAFVPIESEGITSLDVEGMSVTLVGDPGGLAIRQWENHGLEGGTHHLIPKCLAEREVARLLEALAEAVALLQNTPVAFVNEHEASLRGEHAATLYARDMVAWSQKTKAFLAPMISGGLNAQP